MNHRKKHDKTGNLYFAAFNPLTDVIVIGELTKGLQVETGQPTLFTSTSKKKVCDMAFSEWQEDEEGNVTGTPREYEFSVYPESEQEALDEVLTELNGEDGFNVKAIKRPGSKDRLLMFSAHSHGQLSTERKERLKNKKTLKDGKRLKKSQLV